MNILYCILHGQIDSQRYTNVVKTWGKNVNFIFYSDHEDINKKIIKVSNRTDYHSNEEKNVNAFKVIANDPKLNGNDYYFFCDNDTFVNTEALEKFITENKLDEMKIHGRVDNTWQPDKTLHYCSGGAGYLMSKKLLLDIFKNCKNYSTGYSDVSIGIFARENNIEFQHHDGFNSNPPWNPKCLNLNISNQITFHYIKTIDEMKKVEGYFNGEK